MREKRGLSFPSVYSGFAPGLHAGAFSINLQTRPDQLAQAVQVAREVVERFVAEGPTEEELRAARTTRWAALRCASTATTKLLDVVNIATYGLPLDYLDGWTRRVKPSPWPTSSGCHGGRKLPAKNSAHGRNRDEFGRAWAGGPCKQGAKIARFEQCQAVCGVARLPCVKVWPAAARPSAASPTRKRQGARARAKSTHHRRAMGAPACLCPSAPACAHARPRA